MVSAPADSCARVGLSGIPDGGCSRKMCRHRLDPAHLSSATASEQDLDGQNIQYIPRREVFLGLAIEASLSLYLSLTRGID